MPTFNNAKKDPAAADRAHDEREVAKAEDPNQSKHSNNHTTTTT
jgi:hypothetical protein